MLATASLVLAWTYATLPAVSLLIAWRRTGLVRRGVIGAWLSGLLLSALLLGIYSIALAGPVPVWQAALTLDIGVGIMLWLRLVDFALTASLRRIFRWIKSIYRRAAVVALLRVVLLGGFAVPWVMAALMVYRPRIPTNDQTFDLIAPADRVTFPAADGTPIHGWYFAPTEASNSTVLLCHGLGGTPAGMVRLIDGLHAAGVGVLAIDLRAHGTSGGQRCTFGATEKRDALGAIDWLKSNYPEEAERVIGVGASLGAAALLGAAADDSRLDGVVVLSTYSSLPEEVNDIARDQLAWPIGWLTRTIGLPMASLHAGVDLRTVRPIDDIAKLWPRPLLIVHGTADEIIPLDHGRRLFDAAPIGRSSLRVANGTHNGILDDDAVLKRIVAFIRSARPVPVV